MAEQHFDIVRGEAIGLIPARGGSKSIPLKNLHPLGGKPLIQWSIDAAQEVGNTLSKLFCSTDHPDIIELCERSGVGCIRRPKALAGDDAPVTDAIRHCLKVLADQNNGSIPEIVVLLQPTSPFVRPEDITDLVDLLINDSEALSAQTIMPVYHNSHAFNQRLLDESNQVSFHFKNERALAYNKQRKPVLYLFGNLVATRSTALLDGKDCFAEPSIGKIIDRFHALDVDSPDDFKLAELMIADNLVRTGKRDD
jgi:CMP-N,N'-diacetyllegionaminic acid synthase